MARFQWFYAVLVGGLVWLSPVSVGWAASVAAPRDHPGLHATIRADHPQRGAASAIASGAPLSHPGGGQRIGSHPSPGASRPTIQDPHLRGAAGQRPGGSGSSGSRWFARLLRHFQGRSVDDMKAWANTLDRKTPRVATNRLRVVRQPPKAKPLYIRDHPRFVEDEHRHEPPAVAGPRRRLPAQGPSTR